MIQGNKFYTKDHDWICIGGSQAYIGISAFKLTGIRKIDRIELPVLSSGDTIPQGKTLITLHYNEYAISVQAPVACLFLEANRILAERDWDQIIACPESDGWLFKVALHDIDKNLLIREQDYRDRLSSGTVRQSL